ncbi:MAG: carboxymuconolactone decarboxylase family protein [Myxococcales bacterium]
MSIEALKSRIPDYAKDLRINLGGLGSIEGLTPQQLWGAALASALAARNPEVIKAIAAEAAPHLNAVATDAAKAAAAIMGMNNVYYRSVHLLGGEYGSMPARLRMQVIGNPGVDKVDFELWSLAVSAVNGCGMCLQAHEKELLAKGASKEMVQNGVRIGAIIHAVAVVLEGEDALKG